MNTPHYKKNFELKNTAKDKLEGKYGGVIRLLLLNTLISWLTQLVIDTIGTTTMNSVYARTGSESSVTILSIIFEILLLAAEVLLGVMNAGVTLYFLKLACDQPVSIKDLFYGYKTDSKKILFITGVLVLCQALCLYPGRYLSQNYMSARELRWMLYALGALVVGLCIYIPVSLGISLSYYLMFDFPDHSGKETLALCWRTMKGHRKRLLYLELSFLPLMLLCVLSFGIGLLWLQPYMQMTSTYFYLDMMNPENRVSP